MTVTAAREFRDGLPLHLIDPPVIDARLDRDEAQLDELARDLLKRGMIFPLAVVRVGARYEIVDGFRRYLAANRAGLVAAPAFIYPTKDAALEGVKYVANMLREEMSPADEANFFDELLRGECGGDIEKLAALTGKSVSYVDSRLALFAGYPQVFAAVRARKITLGVAELLNKHFPKNWIEFYLDNAIRAGATRSTVTAWVSEWQASFGNVPQPPAAPESAGPVAPGSTVDPNRCICCGKSDHAYAIRWVPVHTHCQLAILEPLLKQLSGSDT